MTDSTQNTGVAVRLADISFRYADMTMRFDTVFAPASTSAKTAILDFDFATSDSGQRTLSGNAITPRGEAKLRPTA